MKPSMAMEGDEDLSASQNSSSRLLPSSPPIPLPFPPRFLRNSRNALLFRPQPKKQRHRHGLRIQDEDLNPSYHHHHHHHHHHNHSICRHEMEQQSNASHGDSSGHRDLNIACEQTKEQEMKLINSIHSCIAESSELSSGDTWSENERCSSGEDESEDEEEGEGENKDAYEFEYEYENERGFVSPLKALSHIAHIKRKQHHMMMKHYKEEDKGGDLSESLNQPCVVEHDQEMVASPKKNLQQVHFQLEPLVYEKLMSLLMDHYEGSFENFMLSILEANVKQEKNERGVDAEMATTIRKPALSKWKRARFDQLKGIETQELVQAFRSLAKSRSCVEVSVDLLNTPWQELSMSQIQKMLDETKKMLFVNEKMYGCQHPDCGRKFTTPGNLRDHLNEHSGDKPYSCSFEDCAHRFTSKQLLCRHMKKHERAHRCTFEGCNKRFAFRERLIVHQKIHSDERPLSCPWEGCGKTFKWANSLHGHMRTHTGEKPFQCTFSGCGRLFGYKVDLTRHRRTHFGQPARSSH